MSFDIDMYICREHWYDVIRSNVADAYFTVTDNNIFEQHKTAADP